MHASTPRIRDRLKGELAEVQAHLKNMSELEGRLSVTQQQLQIAEDELQQARMKHATSQADFTTLQATHSQSRSDFERLQKENNELEERARDAENKVQLLLNQVESSVDNYRRQSRLAEGTPTMNGIYPSSGNNDASHSRNLSDSDNSTTSGNEVRNSMALDSLASELETLRSHWETTNRTYRLSDRFDFETRPPMLDSHDPFGGSLANVRQGLAVGSADVSPPNEGEGTITPQDDEHTPTQANSR